MSRLIDRLLFRFAEIFPEMPPPRPWENPDREAARPGTKERLGSDPGQGDSGKTALWRRLSAGVLTAWLLCSPTGLVMAGPIAEAAGAAATRPTVTTTTSGVPLVNITAPNAAGISHNRYDRFDVDPIGAVLNNSRTPGSSSLGVQIAANPNLTGRTASLILNEVVTALPSQLNGPLAVFGDQAAVVIANPNGVTCNGCGFLNTSHITLTTGVPQFLTAPGGAPSAFDAATALAFQVRGGRIEITGAGQASPIDRLDLIAETLRVNAGLSVTGALNLLAGRQTVDHATLAILAADPTNTKAAIGQDFAIDASLLGAMTAGSIRLLATPVGMGVRADARLAATGGDLVIGANGDVSIRSASAVRDLVVASAGTVTNLGQVAAARDLAISAAKLDNRDALAIAGRDATFQAPQIDNTGGTLQALENLQLILPGGSIDLSAAPAGTLLGGTGLGVTAQNILVSGAFTHAARLALSADDTLQVDGQLVVGSDLSLSSADRLVANGNVLTTGNLTTNAQQTILGSTGRFEAAGNIGLTSAVLNNAGTIYSHQDLTLVVADFTNSGQILAENDARLNIGATASNAGGTIAAAQDLTLTLAATQDLKGLVGAGRDMALNFGDYTHLANQTQYQSGRDLTIMANNLTNADLFEAPRDLTINVAGQLANNGGQLLAGQDIKVTAGSVVNTAGTIEAVRDVTITAATITNQRGALGSVHTNWGDYQPPGSVNCKSDHGYCESWQQVETTPAAVISAGRNLKLASTGTVTNLGSLLTAGNDIQIDADTFNNTARTLTTTWHGHWGRWHGGFQSSYTWHDDYGTSVSGNTPAVVESGGTITINATNQSNSGNITGTSVWLGGANVTNGLTDYRYQTPPTTLPPSVVDLSAAKMPANVKFDANAPVLFSSATRLAMLVPLGGNILNAALPAELRNTQTPFLMDGWLEREALRQAALSEAGRSAFFLTGDLDSERLALLDNAAKYANREGLRLGTALSSEQIARLTEPMLWYVEETITGPDGKTYTALVPKLYLPDSSRTELANTAGGAIRGHDITIEAQTVRNTGFVVADGTLTVKADQLTNEKRSADITNGGGEIRQYVEDAGYWKITGDTVQPGGFMTAATLNLDSKRIESISGEFYQNGQEVSASLAKALGENFISRTNEDHIQQKFIENKSDNGLFQVVVMVVAVIIAIYTAGAASAALASAAESAASATITEGLVAGTITSVEQAVAVQASYGMWAATGFANAAVSAGLAGMASSATSQLLTTGKLDAGQMFKAGMTSGITAGLTSGLNLDKLDGLSNTANGTVATGAGSTDWGIKALGWTARAGVSAGVNAAINGGSFKTAFVNDFVSNAAAGIANKIGDLKQDGSINEVERVAAHGVLGCAAQAASGGQCAGGAIGAMSASIAGNFVNDPKSTFEKALIVGGLSGLGGLAAIAAGQDGTSGFNAAKNEVQNNRLLHPSEQQRAKQLYELAQKQGLPYTLADIEDAMRWANYKGENAGTNTYVNAAKDATLSGPAGDAYASKTFDLMRPGIDTNSKVGYISAGMENGQLTLVQDMAGVAKPTADLTTFIQTNTTGYTWSPGSTVQTTDPNAGKAWTSNGYVPITNGSNNVSYVSVTANGQSFTVPVADCPAGGCTNGSPIAWNSTNPGDKEILAAYQSALDKEGSKSLVKLGIGSAAAVLAPPTLIGTVAGGAVIGGGSSAAEQLIDTGRLDAGKTTVDTVVGAVAGGATYGVIKGAGAADALLEGMLPFAMKEGKPVVENEANSGIRASVDFYVTSQGISVPATGYRAVGGPAVAEAQSGVISPRNPTYITFDNIKDMNPSDVQSLLQLPRVPSHWVSFDTLPLVNDLAIPSGRWGTTSTLEPITKTFPEWGAGGGTQAITNQPIKIKDFGRLPVGN